MSTSDWWGRVHEPHHARSRHRRTLWSSFLKTASKRYGIRKSWCTKLSIFVAVVICNIWMGVDTKNLTNAINGRTAQCKIRCNIFGIHQGGGDMNPQSLNNEILVFVATLLFLDSRFLICRSSYFNFNSFPFLFLILISFLILLLDCGLLNSLALLNWRKFWLLLLCLVFYVGRSNIFRLLIHWCD